MKKQADGRYRSKVTVGHMDGKPIIKYASGRTKKELAENVEELKREYINGNTVARRDVLFCEYAIEWYETYKKPKLKTASSRASYAHALNKHILPAFEDRQLRAVTSESLQQFMNSKAGMGKTSITYLHTILRNVCRMATLRGILDRDPSLGLEKPATEIKSKRALTPSEEAAALKVGHEHPEGLLLLLLYYTGMRIGEVIGLQWRDVDFQKRTINVGRDMDYIAGELGKPKTASSIRSVPMPEELSKALWSRRGFGGTFIVQADKTSAPLPKASLVKRWKRLMTAMVEAAPSIESENGKSILTAHYFRHNYASMLYNADVDILSAQRFLGHADVKTTLAIYSHLSKGKEDANAEKVRSVFAKKNKVAEKLPE